MPQGAGEHIQRISPGQRPPGNADVFQGDHRIERLAGELAQQSGGCVSGKLIALLEVAPGVCVGRLGEIEPVRNPPVIKKSR